MTVEAIAALCSVLGAGVVNDLWTPRRHYLAVRAIGVAALFVGGYTALPLFGDPDSTSAYLRMATALWLPQVILGVLPRREEVDSPHGS